MQAAAVPTGWLSTKNTKIARKFTLELRSQAFHHSSKSLWRKVSYVNAIIPERICFVPIAVRIGTFQPMPLMLSNFGNANDNDPANADGSEKVTEEGTWML